MMNLKEAISVNAEKLDALLTEQLRGTNSDARRAWEAMRYSTLSAGKRFRPFLTIEAASMLSGNGEAALWFAAALEMVHAYSLIHDDLPCMDNDDFRRGKLTCHKVYGESDALLAGDALLTEAFHLISVSPATDRQKVAAVRVLSKGAGCSGMIAGQIMDLNAEHHRITFDTLKRMYDNKTGAMMRTAVGLGCIASDIYGGDAYDALETYATNIGLCYQIVDDLLDVFGNENLGKPIGSDARNGKNTYLTFVSPNRARADAQALTDAAKKAIESIDTNGILSEFADFLLTRTR